MKRSIPGYFYDEKRNRYFKINNSNVKGVIHGDEEKRYDILLNKKMVLRDYLFRRELGFSNVDADIFSFPNQLHEISLLKSKNITDFYYDEDRNSLIFSDSFGNILEGNIENKNGASFISNTKTIFSDRKAPSVVCIKGNQDAVFSVFGGCGKSHPVVAVKPHKSNSFTPTFSFNNEIFSFDISNSFMATGGVKKIYIHHNMDFVQQYDVEQSDPMCLKISDNLLYAGCRNGSLCAFDLRNGSFRNPVIQSKKSPFPSLFSGIHEYGDSYILSIGSPHIVLLDKRKSFNQPVVSYEGHVNSHMRLGNLLFQDNFICSGSDGLLRKWNINNAMPTAIIGKKKGIFKTLQFINGSFINPFLLGIIEREELKGFEFYY